MKMYGSFTEQVDSKFRASDNSEVTLAPFATPGADITFTLPGISISDNLVSDTSSSTLTNKTLTLPQIASLSPDGVETLTFPVATDTLVGKNTTDILTNKTLGISNTVTLLDTLFTLEDNSTNNQLDFELSLLTANRTLSSPDASGILTLTDASQTLTNKSIDADNNTITNIDNNDIKALAGIDATKVADGSVDNTEFQKLGTVGIDALGEIVSTDSTQTLTNKTLTSPAINSPEINEAVALTATSTELNQLDGISTVSTVQSQIDGKQPDVITTRGDVVYGDVSGEAARLPIGTAGQVLTSDGTDVSWSTPAGTGDVTSANNITDNRLVRGDGGAKGVQESGITVSDTDDITGINDLTVEGIIKNPNSIHTVTDADYTITDTDGYSLILVSGGSVDRTITLPTLADNIGRVITIKRIDAPVAGQASIIIDAEGAETIDGATTTKIGRRYGGQYTGKYATITLKAGPTEWHVISSANDIIYQESTTSWSTSIQNANSVAVPAGTWQITVFSYKSAGSAGSNLSVGVSTTSASYDTSPGYRSYTFPNNGFGTTSLTVVVKPTTETTYYHVFNTDSVTGGATGNHMMVITRI